MSHPDVSLVNILLSITRVSLVQNKCVFCQLRVHFKSMMADAVAYFEVQYGHYSRCNYENDYLSRSSQSSLFLLSISTFLTQFVVNLKLCCTFLVAEASHAYIMCSNALNHCCPSLITSLRYVSLYSIHLDN